MSILGDHLRELEEGSVEEAAEKVYRPVLIIRYWRSLSREAKRVHMRFADLAAKEMLKDGEEIIGHHGILASDGLMKSLMKRGMSEKDALEVRMFTSGLAYYRLHDLMPNPLSYEQWEERVKMATSDPKIRSEYLGALKRAFDYSPNPKSFYIGQSLVRKLVESKHPAVAGMNEIEIGRFGYSVDGAFLKIAEEAGQPFEPTLSQSVSMQERISGVVRDAEARTGGKVKTSIEFVARGRSKPRKTRN